MRVRSVEDILLQEAGVPVDILAKAKERLKDDKTLGDALNELGALDAVGWARAQAIYYGLPYSETIPSSEQSGELLAKVPILFAKQHQLLPLAQREGRIIVAIVDPREIFAL